MRTYFDVRKHLHQHTHSLRDPFNQTGRLKQWTANYRALMEISTMRRIHVRRMSLGAVHADSCSYYNMSRAIGDSNWSLLTSYLVCYSLMDRYQKGCWGLALKGRMARRRAGNRDSFWKASWRRSWPLRIRESSSSCSGSPVRKLPLRSTDARYCMKTGKWYRSVEGSGS